MDDDEFPIEEEEQIEIDYGNNGFVLRSPIFECQWKVIFDDPDQEPIDINSDTEWPLVVNSVSISEKEMKGFDSLRVTESEKI